MAVSPFRIGILMDIVGPNGEHDPTIMPTLQLVADEYREQGVLDRPVEFVKKGVHGLPTGSFRAVRDAFDELVEEDVHVIYGPWISENVVPLRRYVEEKAEVACISMAASANLLGEWMFSLPAGSMEEEPLVIATVAHLDGCRTVAIAHEGSLIGNEYLRATRAACEQLGLRITAEVSVPQLETGKREAIEALGAERPDGIIHVGFGLALRGMNTALEEYGWIPRRYTTTAFQFAPNDADWRRHLAGWVGLDQFDERNDVGQDFLDRYQARYGDRPAYYFPTYTYDIGRVMMLALSRARPLTGEGVKDALETIKLLPAASGAPGTRIRFGRYMRQGWVGSEYLVARRVLDDASTTVLHGTIEGLVQPA